MGLGSAWERLKGNLESKGVSALTGHLLKLAGDGSFGEVVAKSYWAIHHNGAKIAGWLALALGIVQMAESTGVCKDMGWDCSDAAVSMGKFIAFVTASGLLAADQAIGALDVKPPEKPLALVAEAIKDRKPADKITS